MFQFPRFHSRVHDLEAHSKVCSISPSESPKTVKKVHSSPRLSSESSRKLLVQPLTNGISAGEHLVVNVTRTSPGTTDLAPFKVVTKVGILNVLEQEWEHVHV